MTGMLDCSRTVLTPMPAANLLNLPDAPATVDQLFRCVRELGHDGPHVGVLVEMDLPTLHWSDDDSQSTAYVASDTQAVTAADQCGAKDPSAGGRASEWPRCGRQAGHDGDHLY